MPLQKLFNQAASIVGIALAALPGPVFAAYDLNMPRGITTISNEVYDLHMLAFWMVTCIGVVVFGLMIWSIIHHRKSSGVKAAHFHHSTKWEAVWTVIPILILLSFAAPATRTLIVMEDAGDTEMTIKVTGYQWRWHYDYLDEGIGFFSSLAPAHNEARQLGSGIDVSKIENYLLEVDDPVVVPIDTKIQLLLTSNDVIHAWWIPELGWKRDAIPGYINSNWTLISEPGTYRGQCAELCGRDHGYMPIVLKAVSQDDYRLWVGEKRRQQAEAAAGVNRDWGMAELMQRGEAVYRSACIGCHQANGQGIPPAFPALTDSPVATGPIENHVNIVFNGSPGTTMQAFGQQLNAVDIAAVVTYERNALGNAVGDMIQPAEIQGAQ
jgi:cytochrome c oxidase subunit II